VEFATGLAISLEAGAGLFAKHGTNDYSHEEAEAEDCGGCEPLIVLEKHLEAKSPG
jgi:hypothetical protein